MNKFDAFFNWVDYKFPKSIRWLLYALFIIFVIAFHILLISLGVLLGVIFFQFIPEKLEVLGHGWAVIIYFFFFFPIFLAILYGGIYLYMKIFGLK